jgi:hypothetical protein
VKRRAVRVETGSPEESGLIGREDFGEVLRFNCAKINSKERGPHVAAVAPERFTAMGLMSATPIQKAPRKKASSAIFVMVVV